MFPYYYSTPSDADYLRALAEERAAREQYAAARRAQEEARQRAARARAARRSYISPYSSYHDEPDYGLGYPDLDVADADMDLDYYPRQRPLGLPSGATPFGYRGLDPYQQRLLMEEQRRKELLELERERERRRLEEERIRRVLQEERLREEAARQKMLEEERLRRAIEEEKLRRAVEEEKLKKLAEEERLRRALHDEEEARRERSQQDALEPLLRALGFAPATAADSDCEKIRASRAQRTQHHRRTEKASPVRPFPFGHTQARTPSPKAPSPPPTTIPINSPRRRPMPSLAEQAAAAEKIQEAFRAFAARKHSLQTVSQIRKRFLAARNGFTLPITLDFDVSKNGRVPTTVSVDSTLSATYSCSSPAHEEGSTSARAPKLAYTPTNAPLHAYEEELNRILGALDAVESRGDTGVRMARRELARAVEREAEHVEGWSGAVWQWWTVQQAQEQEKKAEVQAVPAEAVEQQESATSASSTFTVPVADATSVPVSELQPMEVEPTAQQEVQPPTETLTEAPSAISAPPVPAPELAAEQSPETPEEVSEAEGISVTLDPIDIEVTDAATVDEAPLPSASPSSSEAPTPSPAPAHEFESAFQIEPDTPVESECTTISSSNDESGAETEVEMEVESEPHEALTPPQPAHVPLARVEVVIEDASEAVSAGTPVIEEKRPENHEARTDPTALEL